MVDPERFDQAGAVGPRSLTLVGAESATSRLVAIAVSILLGVAAVGGQNQTRGPTFTQWSTLCDGVERAAAIALADLDRDGDLDLVVGNGMHTNEVDWVYSNDGHGAFYGKRALSPQADPTYGIAVGDVDNDGDLDVFVANDIGFPSLVHRNDGKGNFGHPVYFGSPTHTRRAIALGDFDRDGDVDAVVVGLSQDHIYLNERRGERWSEVALGTREAGDAPRATGVAVGDIDGDRDLDIVVPGRYEARSVIYINDGKAGFSETRPFGSIKDDTTYAALADIDRDGDLDIIAVNWEQPHAIHLNDGRGRFTALGTFGDGRERTWSAATADIDLDGDVDVVAGNANIGYWRTDVNGDGRSEVFGNESRDVPSRVYINDGRGTLSAGVAIRSGSDNTRPIAVGDIDGDGDLDVVMGNDCQPNNVFFNSLRGLVSTSDRLP